MITLLDLLNENNHYIEESGINFKGTDKEYTHGYVTEFYNEAFKPFKDLPINFLEIGIASGASLRLWREYFTQAEIYAVDPLNRLNPVVEPYLPRLNVYFENGYSHEFLNKIPNMDIIIDDGPHTFESQLNCIKMYVNKLNPGGLLIIEDIASISYVESFVQEVVPLQFEIIDTRHKYNRYDNVMFIVRK